MYSRTLTGWLWNSTQKMTDATHNPPHGWMITLGLLVLFLLGRIQKFAADLCFFSIFVERRTRPFGRRSLGADSSSICLKYRHFVVYVCK